MDTSNSKQPLSSKTADSDMEYSDYRQESYESSLPSLESMDDDTNESDLFFHVPGLFDDDAEMPGSGSQINESVITPESLRKDYCFIEEIGHGAQGKIYKAKRLKDDKDVVVKQLNISSIKSWKEYDLFHREAGILQSINMDGVARFYDAIDCLDDEPPCSYIVQEYISGFSLQQMIQSGHRFLVTDVYDILIQILNILNRLHHHEPPVIHRDIKPSNIMISTDNSGRFKATIIDFGAVANPQVQGGGSTVAGTIGYMPPEQLMGKPVPASDIYSLAAMAVQLFCGKSPADIPTRDFHLIFEPEMQDKPHELVTTLRQMLEPKVEQRLADVPGIIKKFTNYKENRFESDNTSNRKNSAYDEAYENKLRRVRYLGENGNIDLWQQLPELNRSVPNAYIIPKPNVKKKKKRKKSFNFGKLLTIIFIIISVCFVLFGIITKNELIFDMMIFTGMAWIVMFGFLRLASSSDGNINVDMDDTDNGIRNYDPLFNELMNSSRKGMATIVNVQYVSAEQYQIVMLKTFKPGFVNCYATVHRAPVFKVDYKFNPPDDIRKEDIIHSFCTYTEPENHYGIGDPLPILYKINDHYFEDIVSSMPFPVPVDDVYDNQLTDSSSSLSGISEASAEYIRKFYPKFKKDPGTALTRLMVDIPELQRDAYDVLVQMIETRLNDNKTNMWIETLCIRAIVFMSMRVVRTGVTQIPGSLRVVIEHLKNSNKVSYAGYSVLIQSLPNARAIFDIRDESFWTDVISIFNRLEISGMQKVMSTLKFYPAYIIQKFLNSISDNVLMQILSGEGFVPEICQAVLRNRLHHGLHQYCVRNMLRFALYHMDMTSLNCFVNWLREYEPDTWDNDDCLSFIKTDVYDVSNDNNCTWYNFRQYYNSSYTNMDRHEKEPPKDPILDALMLAITSVYKRYFEVNRNVQFGYIKYLPSRIIEHLLFVANAKSKDGNVNCLRNVLNDLYTLDNVKNQTVVALQTALVEQIQDYTCLGICVRKVVDLITDNKVNKRAGYDELVLDAIRLINCCLKIDNHSNTYISSVIILTQSFFKNYSNLSKLNYYGYKQLVELYGYIINTEGGVNRLLLLGSIPDSIVSTVMTGHYVKNIYQDNILSYLCILSRISKPSDDNVLLMIDIVKASPGNLSCSAVSNILTFYEKAEKTKKCSRELALLKEALNRVYKDPELSNRAKKALSELFK